MYETTMSFSENPDCLHIEAVKDTFCPAAWILPLLEQVKSFYNIPFVGNQENLINVADGKVQIYSYGRLIRLEEGLMLSELYTYVLGMINLGASSLTFIPPQDKPILSSEQKKEEVKEDGAKSKRPKKDKVRDEQERLRK